MRRDDMSQVGYFGIVIPASDFFQGYFIDDTFDEQAKDIVSRLRTDPRVKETQIRVALSNVPEGDQALLGGLCATLTAAAMGRTEYPNSILATCGFAVKLLIRRNYFWIEAAEEDAGTRTTIEPMDVTSIDKARQHLGSLPAVLAIKTRLLAGLRRDTQSH